MLRPMVLPLRIAGAAVGGFHDAGAAAGADHETAKSRESLAGSETVAAHSVVQPGQFAGLVVIVAERAFFLDAGGTEEDDGVVNSLFLEMGKRPEIFREEAERTRLGALKKGFFAVGDRAALSELVGKGYQTRILSFRQTTIVHRKQYLRSAREVVHHAPALKSYLVQLELEALLCLKLIICILIISLVLLLTVKIARLPLSRKHFVKIARKLKLSQASPMLSVHCFWPVSSIFVRRAVIGFTVRGSSGLPYRFMQVRFCTRRLSNKCAKSLKKRRLAHLRRPSAGSTVASVNIIGSHG